MTFVAVGQLPTPETDLVGFAWLVAFVLAGFLLLARLSQGVVDGDADERSERDGASPVERIPSSDRPNEARARGWAGEGDAAQRRPAPPPTGDAGTASDAGASDGDDDVSEGSHSPPVAHPLAPEGAITRPRSGDDSLEERPQLTHAERQIRSAAAPADDPTMTPTLLLLNVALTQGLFGAILAGGAWYFGVPLDVLGVDGAALSTGLPAVAVGVGFGLALWVGNELASGFAASSGADYDEGLRELLAPDGRRGWVLLLGATLPTIAVVEEFVFRAAVVGATTAAVGVSPWLLAVVSSIAFALGHGAQGRVGVAVTGGLGLALAAAFVLTNSLLVVIVAHYLVNALEFLVHEGLGLPDPVWS